MKLIYLVNPISGPGGLERVLSLKTNYLCEHYDYEIHFIVLNERGKEPFYEFSKKLKFHNIVVGGNPFNYIFGYSKQIRTLIKKIDPDIMIVCDDGLKGFFVPYVLGKSRPMIFERHASKNIIKNQDRPSFVKNLKFWIYSALMNFGGRRYDAFVVLTNYNLAEWKLNNLRVIPNPLSFYPVESSLLTNKKVIAVGNHGFQKGYDRLLQSWKIVLEEHPDWRLEIYGKMDTDRKHVKLAEKLGISDSINFFNPVKNIEDKYKEASICAMSSRSEGFGMVLIEAMACGVPCVSYNCPSGPKDIITEGEDGLLISNGEIEDFGKALIYLMDNQDIRIEMGRRARQNVKRYFVKNIAEEWDELFNSLLRL